MKSLFVCLSVASVNKALKNPLRMSFHTIKPILPKSVVSGFGESLKQTMEFQVKSLVNAAIISDDQRDDTFRKSRKVISNTNKILFAVRTGDLADCDNCVQETKDILTNLVQDQKSTVRESRLEQAVEKFTEAKLLLYFYQSGMLASQVDMSPCNDNEYIGAVLGFCQELARYAMSRATEGDIQSVSLCKHLIYQIHESLLAFNFRNGHLRRKYDSLKYAIRTIENIICELSFLGKMEDKSIFQVMNSSMEIDEEINVDSYKKIKLTNESTDQSPNTDEKSIKNTQEIQLIDKDVFDEIRQRMEKEDSIREDVIKMSRDVQKLSKQAIYSIHRQGYNKAKEQLSQCEVIITKILNAITDYPQLRYGAISNCIEEYVEGKLFLYYMESQSLLTIQQFQPLLIDTVEYIGGLSDLTGELGRYAVIKASERDYNSVHDILQVDLIISATITEINFNGKYTKKNDQVTQNVRKVEDLLYELSLQRLGGRAVNSLRERDIPLSTNTTAGDNVDLDNV